jgi:hypothetical protein
LLFSSLMSLRVPIQYAYKIDYKIRISRISGKKMG